MWLPLLDGTERIGVLRLTLAGGGRVLEPLRDGVRALRALDRAVGGDEERVRGLLRAVAPHFADDARERAGLGARPAARARLRGLRALGPARAVFDIGGDAFDYALDGGVLHFAVFDAMGHGLGAASMASLALSAYRHSRRAGNGPAAAYTAIDAALGEQDLASRFVTALIAELDLATGDLRWVSAGHPAPLLLRRGRLVKALDVGLPRRSRFNSPPTLRSKDRESIEPGDMVLLYTDGLTEARRPGGELFTVERLGEFIEREAASGRAAPETLRRLREAIIERGAGALTDDATAVLVEWRRGTERRCCPTPPEPSESPPRAGRPGP